MRYNSWKHETTLSFANTSNRNINIFTQYLLVATTIRIGAVELEAADEDWKAQRSRWKYGTGTPKDTCIVWCNYTRFASDGKEEQGER